MCLSSYIATKNKTATIERYSTTNSASFVRFVATNFTFQIAMTSLSDRIDSIQETASIDMRYPTCRRGSQNSRHRSLVNFQTQNKSAASRSSERSLLTYTELHTTNRTRWGWMNFDKTATNPTTNSQQIERSKVLVTEKSATNSRAGPTATRRWPNSANSIYREPVAQQTHDDKSTANSVTNRNVCNKSATNYSSGFWKRLTDSCMVACPACNHADRRGKC